MIDHFEVNQSTPPAAPRFLRTSWKIAGLLLCLFIFSSSVTWAAGSGFSYTRSPAGAPAVTGKVTADGAEDIGDTRFFWAYAQGFFTGYYTLSATCQMIGENSYIYTEDAYINDISASVASDVLFAAGSGVLFKSVDGGQSWTLAVEGLPDADGDYASFDSTNFNYLAEMHCLFSRAEYGETFDTVWVGTEYGAFWSTNGGVSFSDRHQGMSKRMEDTTEVNEKPATYDILGHPTNTKTLWAATEDGVYMTRNANKWITLASAQPPITASGGLPPSEGTSWRAAPVYALFYDSEDSVLYASTSKGVFYCKTRPLGSATQPIIASWIPVGGEVEFTVNSVVEDGAYLGIPDTTTLGFEITAGQYVTIVDTSQQIYWMTLVDESPEGLYTFLTDSRIFYFPEGISAPTVDYWELLVDSVIVDTTGAPIDTVFIDTPVLAFGYSQVPGLSIFVDVLDDTTTIWLGTEESGLISYRFIGGISGVYSTSQVSVNSSHEGTSIYKIAQLDNVYYLATDQGLFKATDLHGDWTQLTGCIRNNDGSDSLAVDARTIAFGSGDQIFTGGFMGGFLRSQDGINFAPSNLGLMHRNGTPMQLALFLDEFENITPADPLKGIFETMQEWWGELDPADDIDGDPRISILFLDIDDQYHLATGDGTFISGYYDGINEYSRLYFSESNQAEMIYLDTEPQWINRAGPAACNQMFNPINWNQDFEEEEWLREGLASFSQHVAGYPVAEGVITFPSLNSLTAWGDANRDTEHLYCFLLMLYLYEQPYLFPNDSTGSDVVHTIAEIATSSYRGVSGLGRLIYEKTIGSTADSLDYTATFEAVYNDFVLAGALDISDTTFHSGKYGFTAVNTRINASNKNWYWPADAPPPYDFHVPFWSVRAFQILDEPFPISYFNPEHPIYEVTVNGDDRNRLNFHLLFSNTSQFIPEMSADLVTVIHVPTDSVKQKGGVVLPEELQILGTSEPPNNMRIIAICTSELGDAPSCFTFGDDVTPPPFLSLTVAQNPIDDRYLDIYSFTDERIFPDGGQLYWVDDIGLSHLEGPMVDILGGISAETGDSTVITLDQNVFFSNTQGSDFVYHIAFYLDNLEFPATLQFLAYGEDICGNEKESIPDTVTVDFIQSQLGGTLRHASSATSLHIPPTALKKDSYILLSVSDYPFSMVQEEIVSRAVAAPSDASHHAVGPLVSAGSAGLDLSTPVELQIPYDPFLAGESEIGVYRAEGDSWIYVGGVVNSEMGLLKTYSWKFGQFRAFAGPLEDMKPEMPYSFRLDQNYPNPFNPVTQIQFELTRSQHVKVDIYNLIGRLVTRLADTNYDAGRHILQWRPGNLASGVYFLRLEAEEGILYRKMMLLK